MLDLTRCAVSASLLGSVVACGGTGSPSATTPPGSTAGSATRCSVARPLASPASTTGVVVSAIGGSGCSDWGCGGNSPTVGDGVVFDELDTRGDPDSHGIKIIKATHEGARVALHVDRHFLSAVTTDQPVPTVFEHRKLIGTIITLADKSGASYDLLIDDVQEHALAFWAVQRTASGAPAEPAEYVPFYRILTRALHEPNFKEPICKKTVAAAEPVWGPVEHYALAFAGDHYDAAHRKVEDAPAGSTLFNLACAGTAPAKMHLMRHTNAGAVNADGARSYATTIDQRQAMLKMFTADYCGDGSNGAELTVDGEPLLYGDAKAWYGDTPTTARLDPHGAGALDPRLGTMEALWGPDGVVCLDTPRRVSLATVRAACPKTTFRSCSWPDDIAHWEDRYHVISVDPPCPAPPPGAAAR